MFSSVQSSNAKIPVLIIQQKIYITYAAYVMYIFCWIIKTGILYGMLMHKHQTCTNECHEFLTYKSDEWVDY